MNILLSYPQIVESYSPSFEDLFSPEGYIYFQRYLSGLMVSENKTIEAINRLFVLERRNQSSFNRFMTRQNFDVAALHRRRLDWLQGQAATRFKPLNEGVIALDDTLLSHYGRKMEHIYNLYDHVDEHYTLAHNLVSLHYSDDTTDYPIAHDLWIPPDWEAIALTMKSLGIQINADRFLTRLTKPTKWRNYMRDRFRTYKDRQPILKSMYQTKLTLGLAMLRQFRADYPTIDLPVAMDSGYTAAEMCQALDKDLNIAYVGSLAAGQTLILSGSEEITLGDFKKRLVEQHLTKAPDGTQPNSKFFKTSVSYKGKKLVLYAYCANHHVKGYHKKQRLGTIKK